MSTTAPSPEEHGQGADHEPAEEGQGGGNRQHRRAYAGLSEGGALSLAQRKDSLADDIGDGGQPERGGQAGRAGDDQCDDDQGRDAGRAESHEHAEAHAGDQRADEERLDWGGDQRGLHLELGRAEESADDQEKRREGDHATDE